VATGDSPKRESKGPRINVIRSLADVIRDAEQNEREARKHLARAERLVEELYAIERWIAQNRGADRRPWRGHRMTVPAGTGPVAHNLAIEQLGDGTTAATINGGKRITLPPALAALLETLAADDGASPDELVAWKSFERIREVLEKRLLRKYSRHAVSQLLWRLRGALNSGGSDRGLVESTTAGARLRYTRRAVAGPPCAAQL